MSEGIKPAAYMYQTGSGEYLGVSRNICTSVNIPLYTKEQLRPRVKMTQAEFDEWKQLDFEENIFGLLGQLLNDVIKPIYPNLTRKIYGLNGADIEDSSKQLELCNLWVNYSPEHPEETIEIVSIKKWFVRSKKPDSDGDFQFLNGIDEPNDWGYSHNEEDTNNPRNIAYPFDTKERAEEWKNPITEVVLLPIGDE